MRQDKETRSKRAQSVRYHLLRILLFGCALLCAVVGMLMISFTMNSHTRAQTVVSSLQATKPQVNVLLVASYSVDDIITANECAGFVDIMRRSSVNADVQYMDAHKLAVSPGAQTQWDELFRAKLQASGPYSAIACADDEALRYIMEHHAELFAQTPVVFFGINDKDLAENASKSGYATGIFENTGLSNTMRLAKTLLPNATKFAAVVDSTPAGIGSRKQFEAALSDFSGTSAEFIDASSMTREQLRERLAGVSKDTILFYLDAAIDASGSAYTIDENTYFMAEAASVPVFRATNGGMGEGICGAGFTDPEAVGQLAAGMTVEVLNGKRPADIALVTESPVNQMVDMNIISKYSLGTEKLTSDVVLINEPMISWNNIRPLLLPVGLLIVALVLVSIFAIMGYRRSIRDTREIIQSQNDLRHRLFHSQLTDLPNLQWLNEYMADPANARKIKSVVKIDIDDFIDINDSYGHAAGDIVIKEFAERLRKLKPEIIVNPTVDEFILGFDHKFNSGDANEKRIRETIDRSVNIQDFDISVSACLGIANVSKDLKASDLFSAADLAMRFAKEAAGKHSTVYYRSEMRDEVESRLQITDKLKEAIDSENLNVLYQPQVDTQTLDVTGYEALVRLEGNEYYPSEFIPVAEMSGLVIEIDRVVTKKVIQQLATWKKRHKRLRPVSINYSATQIKDVAYIDYVEKLLKEYDVAPNLIKIEITESLMIDKKDHAVRLFKRLQEAGIAIALDDFGTGYTSLARMSAIPADIVKIDKSLVDAYMQPGKEGFIDNLTQLIHGLDKKVIVEGVETEEQYKICKKLGCDVIQGYYFSKPLLPERAAQFEASKK